MPELKSIAVLGATGAVGKQVVTELLSVPSITKITTVTRRALTDPVAAADPRVHQIVLDPFTEEALRSEQVRTALEGTDAAISTMGAGKTSAVTLEEFRMADLQLPVAFAQTAREANVPHFSLMTAAGSDASSSVWITKPMAGLAIYRKVKGEAEVAIADMNFPSTHIDRPASILENPNSGFFGNQVMRLFGPILCGAFTNLTVTELAQGMIRAIQHAVAGTPALAEGGLITREDGTAVEPRDSLRVYDAADLRVMCGEFRAMYSPAPSEVAAPADGAAAPAAAPAAADGAAKENVEGTPSN